MQRQSHLRCLQRMITIRSRSTCLRNLVSAKWIHLVKSEEEKMRNRTKNRTLYCIYNIRQDVLTGFYRFPLDKPAKKCYIINNIETVDAEITVIMLVQRTRVAENRVKHRSSNGPRRVQIKRIERNTLFCSDSQYSATCGHTSVAGGIVVSHRGAHARELRAAKQGGIADNWFIRP